MVMNKLKTALLLLLLSSILVSLGGLCGGTTGIKFALMGALLINSLAYFFSDALVLKLYKARELQPHEHPEVHAIIDELCGKMEIPTPKVYSIQATMANAFATGRNPARASIAITTGLLELLDIHELRGVLAHELSHIKNRDILIATLAATIATAISYLANMAYYAGLWGGGHASSRKRGNPLALLVVSITMPLAATLVQLAISRSREFIADESAARYSQDPLALVSALQKLQSNLAATPNKGDSRLASTASLFILNPFKAGNWSNLLSTHPPLEARIAKLHQIYDKDMVH